MRDEEKFERLYRECYPALLAYAQRRVGDVGDAADVVAETLLVAWRRLDEVPEGPAARLWLFGVARRTLANQWRGERRRSALAERLLAEPTRAEPPPEEPDVQVTEALARLGAGDREVLMLVAWEGLEPSEVAEVVGCSRAAARVRLHRARGRLRKELDLRPDGGREGPPDVRPAAGQARVRAEEAL